MPAPLRVVFAGTPGFAVPCLHACLQENVDLVAVYSQPDRRAGRGRKLVASPVKQAALEAGIAVEQPASLKAAETQAHLAGLAPDLLVVVAYGQILPQAVLDIPRLDSWNVHASLLPRWRGAAPIQRAIAAGDTETGVCLMRMEAGLDTGPVLLRESTPIRATDTADTLHDRLAALGAGVLGAGLRRTAEGETLAATPQPASGATYAHKLDKAEADLDPAQSATDLERIIRAFDPWPGAALELNGERIRIWRAQALSTPPAIAAGRIVAANAEGIDIACGKGTLRVHELQRPGGRRIRAADYLNAHPELRTDP